MDKYFNTDKQKYFSIWDFKKSFFEEHLNKNTLNEEKLLSVITETLNKQKEFCFPYYFGGSGCQNRWLQYYQGHY